LYINVMRYPGWNILDLIPGICDIVHAHDSEHLQVIYSSCAGDPTDIQTMSLSICELGSMSIGNHDVHGIPISRARFRCIGRVELNFKGADTLFQVLLST
jgi:hypothetical protein